MSNPGVITLANVSSNKGKFKRFVIEDNIGEDIHLHIDNMRIDFTIKEFLSFAEVIRNSLTDLDILCGYSLDDFDEHFLMQCSSFLKDLIDIKVEEIEISKLKCIIHSNYGKDLNYQKVVNVTKVPAYKFLQGEEKEFEKYKQHNYFNKSNKIRLKEILNSIQQNGYPFNNQFIILFNGQNIVRDGQHRLACLAHLFGVSHKVKVLRFNFKSQNHLINYYWLSNSKLFIKFWLKKIVKKIKRLISL